MVANMNFIILASRRLTVPESRNFVNKTLDGIRATPPQAAMLLDYVSGHQEVNWNNPLDVLDAPHQDGQLSFVYFDSREGKKCSISFDFNAQRPSITISFPSDAIESVIPKGTLLTIAAEASHCFDNFCIGFGSELNLDQLDPVSMEKFPDMAKILLDSDVDGFLMLGSQRHIVD